MANKPILGMYICPKCKARCPVFWNGNMENKCVSCGEVFKAKRQKILQPIIALDENAWAAAEEANEKIQEVDAEGADEDIQDS